MTEKGGIKQIIIEEEQYDSDKVAPGHAFVQHTIVYNDETKDQNETISLVKKEDFTIYAFYSVKRVDDYVASPAKGIFMWKRKLIPEDVSDGSFWSERKKTPLQRINRKI